MGGGSGGFTAFPSPGSFPFFTTPSLFATGISLRVTGGSAAPQPPAFQLPGMPQQPASTPLALPAHLQPHFGWVMFQPPAAPGECRRVWQWVWQWVSAFGIGGGGAGVSSIPALSSKSVSSR